MAAYIIADVDVTDSVLFDEYRKQVGPTIEKYGGKYLVRGGTTEAVEGGWSPKRLVILEFESLERAREWYHSPDYSGPKDLRHKSAKTNVTIVEGL